MDADKAAKGQLIDDLVVSFTDKIPRGPAQQPSNEVIQAVMKRSPEDGEDVVDCSDWVALQKYLRKELRLDKKLLFKFTGSIAVGDRAAIPQNIWNATGLAGLRRVLLRETLEVLQECALVELDLVVMGALPKPQAPVERTPKQNAHKQKYDDIFELVYGNSKRQKKVEGAWGEMASRFMMQDNELMRTVRPSRPHPALAPERTPLCARFSSLAALPSFGDV